MKSVIGSIVVALLLAAAGGTCWALGSAERRVAEAHQALATMRYATVADRAADLEQSLRLVAPVPLVGGGLTTAVHQARSTAEYWLARYAALAPGHDAAGAIVERDPQLLLVATNAAYRALDINQADRQALVRSLDGIIKSYAEVLKRSDGHQDAAYNYEFLVRQRDQITRARGPVASAKAGLTVTHPSIHGHLGAPPKDSEMSRFKIMVPKRSEERKENIDAGKGDSKGRKG